MCPNEPVKERGKTERHRLELTITKRPSSDGRQSLDWLKLPLDISEDCRLWGPIIESVSKLSKFLCEKHGDSLICDQIAQRPWNLRSSRLDGSLTGISFVFYLIIVLLIHRVERFNK